MEKNNFVVLINTCDKFEDCWIPFFKLWSLYWKNYNGTIYLNTEYKDFNYPGLEIKCSKCCDSHGYPQNKKAPWSQCLIWADLRMRTLDESSLFGTDCMIVNS